MEKLIKFCAAFTTLCALAGIAHADITVFQPSLNLLDQLTVGKCTFRIHRDDPYIMIDGPCEMERNNEVIAAFPENPRPIPTPRDSTFTQYTVSAFSGTATADDTYCQRFGQNTANLPIVFGHPTDSSQNLTKLGSKTCKSAVPQVQAYWQWHCLGSFVWVFNEYSLIPGVHLSFRRSAQPLLCFAAAVYPGGN